MLIVTVVKTSQTYFMLAEMYVSYLAIIWKNKGGSIKSPMYKLLFNFAHSHIIIALEIT